MPNGTGESKAHTDILGHKYNLITLVHTYAIAHVIKDRICDGIHRTEATVCSQAVLGQVNSESSYVD